MPARGRGDGHQGTMRRPTPGDEETVPWGQSPRPQGMRKGPPGDEEVVSSLDFQHVQTASET
jgi:hypothetical protein